MTRGPHNSASCVEQRLPRAGRLAAKIGIQLAIGQITCGKALGETVTYDTIKVESQDVGYTVGVLVFVGVCVLVLATVGDAKFDNVWVGEGVLLGVLVGVGVELFGGVLS